MIVTLNSPHIRAYNAFTHNPIPGVTEADTDTMTLLMPLAVAPNAVARVKRMKLNFYLKVADDAPDEIKRQHSQFVDPQFRVYPVGG